MNNFDEHSVDLEIMEAKTFIEHETLLIYTFLNYKFHVSYKMRSS